MSTFKIFAKFYFKIALTGGSDWDRQLDQGQIVLEQRGVPSGVDDGHGALEDEVSGISDGVCAEHDIEGRHGGLSIVHAVGGGQYEVFADQGAAAESGASGNGQEESNLEYTNNEISKYIDRDAGRRLGELKALRPE